MKKIVFIFGLMMITSVAFSQKGNLSLEEEIDITTKSVKNAVDHLNNRKGFTVVSSEFPAGYSDSTVYLSYKDGLLEIDVRYSKRISGENFSSIFSNTSTDEKWFKAEIAKIPGLGFFLTEDVLKSETAHDAKIYEKNNVRIQIFWSVYPGSEQKFYSIDVIRF